MKTLIPNRVGYLKSGLAYLLPDVSGSVVRVGFSTPSLEGTIIIQKIPCYRLSTTHTINDSFLFLIAVHKSIGLQKLCSVQVKTADQLTLANGCFIQTWAYATILPL